MSNVYPFQFPADKEPVDEPMDMEARDPNAPMQDPNGMLHYPDGDMMVPVGGEEPEEGELPEDLEFDANLAEHIPESKLTEIAEELLQGIKADDDSRQEWLEDYRYGIKLLGLKIERGSNADAGSNANTIDGMHKTTHPVLLESVLRFLADAGAELLPATGPAKIRDDQPPKPPMQQPMPGVQAMGANGGPPLDDKQQPHGGDQQQAPNISINVPPQQQQPQGHAFGGRVSGYASGGETDDGLPPGYYDDQPIYTERLNTGPVDRSWGDRIPERGMRPPFPMTVTPEEGGHIGYRPTGSQSLAAGGRIEDDYVPMQFANGGYADGGMPSPLGGNPFDQQEGMPDAAAPGALPASAPAQSESDRDVVAEALEKDFNHHLTVTDAGYYADTKRMLFDTGLSGKGIKKVHHCPIKRFPTSVMVPIEDFIVSNAMSDLSNAARITHAIKMRPSVLRRMQLLGTYRDIKLAEPSISDEVNPVHEEKADTAGIQPKTETTGTKDLDYNLYETLCELELDEFAPDNFKGEGLALPFKVTIDRESRKVLEVRRNWKEDDKECRAKEYYVGFTYVEAISFLGIGLLQILGNTARTLTAIQREFVDAGMRATFPSFLYAKGAGRQLTNNFLVGPGGGVGLDTGLKDIREAAMPFPFKDLGAGFVQYAQHIEEYAQRLGGTANIQVGEGKQDAPVGTTLALIEQATKPIGSVLKGLHAAQSKELQLLKERFKEDPEAFWRFNKRPAMAWQVEQFLKALDDHDLVPVSDPNNPTHMHRLAKANMIYQMGKENPQKFNQDKVYDKVFTLSDLGDASELFAPPGPPPIDPKVAGAQAKAQSDGQIAQSKMQHEMAMKQLDMQESALERASKERIADKNLELEKLRLAQSLAIHSSKEEMGAADRALNLDPQQTATQEQDTEHSGMAMDAAMQQHQTQTDADLQREQMARNAEQTHNQMKADAAVKHHKIASEADLHRHKTETHAAVTREKIKSDADVKREIAKMKPKGTTK